MFLRTMGSGAVGVGGGVGGVSSTEQRGLNRIVEFKVMNKLTAILRCIVCLTVVPILGRFVPRVNSRDLTAATGAVTCVIDFVFGFVTDAQCAFGIGTGTGQNTNFALSRIMGCAVRAIYLGLFINLKLTGR